MQTSPAQNSNWRA